MNGYLLDLNVLLALAWPNHVHHGVASRWFAEHSDKDWATCPLTQTGFARISSNPTFTADAVSPLEAVEMLHEITRLPHHEFWPDEIELEQIADLGLLVLGHRQVTDAYLLALAIRRGGRLATLDRGIQTLLPSKSPHRDAVALIPVA